MALQDEKGNELKDIFTTAQFKQYKDFETNLRSKMMAKAKGAK